MLAGLGARWGCMCNGWASVTGYREHGLHVVSRTMLLQHGCPRYPPLSCPDTRAQRECKPPFSTPRHKSPWIKSRCLSSSLETSGHSDSQVLTTTVWGEGKHAPASRLLPTCWKTMAPCSLPLLAASAAVNNSPKEKV